MLTGLAQHVEKRGLSFLDLVRDAGLAVEVFREFEWTRPRVGGGVSRTGS
jgi:hypothetical protein